MSLQLLTLGVAIGDVSHEVREIGAPNDGPRVRWYLQNAGINVAAPWCAAAVQGWSDIAAKARGALNPLDSVLREALVLDYYVWAAAGGMLVPAHLAAFGDLVFYDFNRGGNAWDHVGLLLTPPGSGKAFRAVEGNTGNGDPRDGDGCYIKGRRTDSSYPVAFARWAP